jgi:hypothetical protein
MIFSNGLNLSAISLIIKEKVLDIYTAPSGLKYTGEFKDGAFNGKGTLDSKRCTVQTGNFCNTESLQGNKACNL